ncbi:T9SS type A sorting domain-containing protein [Calditrichota bacterium GD2]
MIRFLAQLFIFFLPLFSLFSQPLLVNVENSPSTFLQTNPKAWKVNGQEILVSWDDYRQGIIAVYGQYLTSDLQFVEKNTPIHGNDNILAINDSTFLAIEQIEKEVDYGGFYITDVTYSGAVYQNHFPLSDPGILFGYTGDACGMGWPEFFFTFLPFNDHFLKIISSDYLSIFYYDFLVNTVRTVEYPDSFPLIVKMEGQAFKHTYWLAGLNDFWKNYQQDSLKLNVFLFDERDSLLKQSTLENFGAITDLGSDYNILEYSIIRTVKLNDSTALLGYWLPETGMIYLFTLDDRAALLKRQTIEIEVDENFNAHDFSLKKGNDGSMLAHLSAIKYVNSQYEKWNYFYYGDSLGNFNGDSFKTSAIFKTLKSTDFIYLKENEFLAVKNINYDIYLSQLEGGREIQSFKINDDSTGSNEDVCGIVVDTDENYLVIYKDEEKCSGRKVVDNQIANDQPEVTLYDSKGAFFKNGDFLNFWVKQHAIGYTLFNADLNVIKSDTLFYSKEYSVKSVNGFVKSDSNFIMAYTVNTDLYLKEINLDGEILKSYQGQCAYEIDLQITPSENSEFWVHTSLSAQKFSQDLQALTNKIELSSNLYLVSLSSYFLVKDKTTYLPKGLILTEHDTIAVEKELAPYGHEFQCVNIDADHFASIFVEKSKLKFRLFNWEGHFIAEKTAPVDSTYFSHVKKFQCVVHDSLLYLAWSNTSLDVTGYNVYAYTMPVDFVTDIKNSAAIPQTTILVNNYPNPFNAETTFEIKLPGNGLTTVTIFNVLGKKVKTLIKNGYRERSFKLRWNGKNDLEMPVSSGVYICQVQYKGQVAHKKLILLK